MSIDASFEKTPTLSSGLNWYAATGSVERTRYALRVAAELVPSLWPCVSAEMRQWQSVTMQWPYTGCGIAIGIAPEQTSPAGMQSLSCRQLSPWWLVGVVPIAHQQCSPWSHIASA